MAPVDFVLTDSRTTPVPRSTLLGSAEHAQSSLVPSMSAGFAGLPLNCCQVRLCFSPVYGDSFVEGAAFHLKLVFFPGYLRSSSATTHCSVQFLVFHCGRHCHRGLITLKLKLATTRGQFPASQTRLKLKTQFCNRRLHATSWSKVQKYTDGLATRLGPTGHQCGIQFSKDFAWMPWSKHLANR